MGGAAPIPFSAIMSYCDYRRLCEEDAEFLLYVIRRVDSAQLAMAAKKQAAKNKTK